MSGWTHAICDDCWDDRNPEKPSPRLDPGGADACCFCGEITHSGLYTKHDPELLKHCTHGGGPGR